LRDGASLASRLLSPVAEHCGDAVKAKAPTPRERRLSFSRRCDVQDTTVTEVGWWSEIDREILASLADGRKSTKELARRLGLSADAVSSLLLMLAAEGRVRVNSVELVETRRG
jgi:DNA-binding CsgD family transcriptional regulator